MATSAEDVKQGMIAYRIAAYARRRPCARLQAGGRLGPGPLPGAVLLRPAQGTVPDTARGTTRRWPTTTFGSPSPARCAGLRFCPMHYFKGIDWDELRSVVAERKRRRPTAAR